CPVLPVYVLFDLLFVFLFFFFQAEDGIRDWSVTGVQTCALPILRQHVCFITRLRLDANLFAPAPARRSGQRGRQPKKGRQLPKLSKILTNRTTRWTKIVMPEWYGGERHTPEIVTGTALWYHSGLPPVPIRWLLVRDPSGVRDPQAFLCTDLNATPAQILGWFVQRWSIETTFQEVRDHLGVETQRQWSDLAILRTTPALLGL